MKKKIISIIVFWICFFAVSSVHADELTKVDANQLQSIVESNKGKVVFINFFATWCPPCRKEISAIINLHKHYKDSEVMFIGISVDIDTEKVKPFMKELGINYPVYLADKEVIYQYNVSSIPHNAIYDYDGVLSLNTPGYISGPDIKKYLDGALRGKK